MRLENLTVRMKRTLYHKSGSNNFYFSLIKGNSHTRPYFWDNRMTWLSVLNFVASEFVVLHAITGGPGLSAAFGSWRSAWLKKFRIFKYILNIFSTWWFELNRFFKVMIWIEYSTYSRYIIVNNLKYIAFYYIEDYI